MTQRDHLSDQQLLELMDGETSAASRWAAERHLAGCAGCRARRDEFRALDARLSSGLAGGEPARATNRARLAERLAGERTPAPSLVGAGARVRWAAVACAAALGALLIQTALLPEHGGSAGGWAAGQAAVEADALPVASLTPGATLQIDAAGLC